MPGKDKNYLFLMILTIVGTAMALAGDLLIGAAVPGAVGKYGIVQASWSQVQIWRPTISMALASLAFPLYLPGLYAVSKRMEETSPRAGRAFLLASFATSTGWLLIHAAYCTPQFVYKYLFDAGYPELAVRLTDKMLDLSIPALAVSGISMLIAFVILFVIIITGKTIYSRWLVLCNPLVIVAATLSLSFLFPDSIFVSSISMCKMNLGMFLFFIAAAVKEQKFNEQKNS